MRVNHKSYNDYIEEALSLILNKRFFAPIMLNEETLMFPCEGIANSYLIISANKQNPLTYFLVDKKGKFFSSITNKFIQKARSVLGTTILKSIELKEDDYVIDIKMKSIDDDAIYIFHCEMIPLKANIYMSNEEDIIIDCLFKEKGRELGCGVQYLYPKQDALSESDACITAKLLYDHYQNEIIVRKKEKYRELEMFLSRHIKAGEKKAHAIEKDVEIAKNNLGYIDIADGILSQGENLHQRLNSVSISGKVVSLDPSKTLLENAQHFYKRARKAKETIARSQINIENALSEMKMYQSMLDEFAKADESKADKICLQLGLNKKKHETHETSFNRPYKINYNGTIIYFGRNASQNDYLSFVMKQDREFTWLHIKDIPGAHLVIANKKPSENDLLLACEISLICSHQTSGEIIYTKKKNVRRGKVLGEALVKNQAIVKLNSVRPESLAIFKSATRVEGDK